MSAYWEVCLRCDKCGRLSSSVVSDRAIYGKKLAELRAFLAERGWEFHRYGPPRPDRDYCKTCTRERR